MTLTVLSVEETEETIVDTINGAAFAMGAVQYDAIDLAKGKIGYYNHYHDKGHTIHIWFSK